MNYIYGPVPSRRLGLSLGVSPIPKKTCNYACIYCQLGRTDQMTNTRQVFYPVDDILSELKTVLANQTKFDVITVVGEGEPTLYAGIGQLIDQMHWMTDKPIAVITNGALLYDTDLQSELINSDIILPSMDAYDELSFRKINRPHRSLTFEKVKQGLENFSHRYPGQLWIEIMLMSGINDDKISIDKYTENLKKIKYDKLYLNTPVRPPAETYAKAIEHDKMSFAAELLGGISIDLLASEGFHSEIKNHYEAILSIIKRHPMNQYEILGFLNTRDCVDRDMVLHRLNHDDAVIRIHYKGYNTYRLK